MVLQLLVYWRAVSSVHGSIPLMFIVVKLKSAQGVWITYEQLRSPHWLIFVNYFWNSVEKCTFCWPTKFIKSRNILYITGTWSHGNRVDLNHLYLASDLAYFTKFIKRYVTFYLAHALNDSDRFTKFDSFPPWFASDMMFTEELNHATFMLPAF